MKQLHSSGAVGC